MLNESVSFLECLVVWVLAIELPSWLGVCVLFVVLCLGCFLGFLVGSWAWEKTFCMLLGSAWAMLGLPSYVGREQLGVMLN